MSSYWQGKGAGKKIAVRFDKPLLGDVTGNEMAFTIKGMVRNPLKYGPLTEKTFTVESVERYPLEQYWRDEFDGELDGLEAGEYGLRLFRPEMGITDAKCYETTSGTTLTGTITANAGDMVLATISHRSVFTTPDGWTKLYESEMIDDDQKLVFASRKSENAGQVSFTAKQSIAGRIYLNLISISGINDIIARPDLEVVKQTAVATVSAPIKNSGEKLIWGCSAAVWLTGGGQWSTSPPDLTLVSLPTSVAARQANFIDDGAGVAENRSFILATSARCIVAAVELAAYFVLFASRTLSLDATELPPTPRFRCETSTPDDTAIIIEYACTDGDEPDSEGWAEIADGDLLTITGTTLWLRYTLTTDDPAVTPTLLSAWLEEPTAPPDTILLTMAPDSRFNDVEGDITVSYEREKGTLTGNRPVEDFTESFTPTGLEPTPINVQGTITAGIEVEVDLIEVDPIEVDYRYFKDDSADHIITAGITVEVDLIPVSVIPP